LNLKWKLELKLKLKLKLKLTLNPSTQFQNLCGSDLLLRRWERGGLEQSPEEEAAWMLGGSQGHSFFSGRI